MLKIKTTKLTGAALDWAVSTIVENSRPFPIWIDGKPQSYAAYSIDWAQGGPIIDREGIEVLCNTSALQAAAYKDADPYWFACLKFKRADHWHGPTPLIAAMRCYVASKLGDTVEIPKELS